MVLQIVSDNTCSSLYRLLYNFAVYKCDRMSVYVTIYFIFKRLTLR